MNVLSLFDGISCGRVALEKAGIPVSNYFASEINKYAIKISKKNYPDIEHIGDVKNVYGFELPKIDLLLGGSPCQGFSFNGKQLNFNDPRSKLFFEYVRLLRECEPEYFLLENVCMKKEFQTTITEALGVEPILINSALVSAQNRKRLYWTNIPGINQPKNKGYLIKDVIEKINHDKLIYSISKNMDNAMLLKISKSIKKQHSHTRIFGVTITDRGIRPYNKTGCNLQELGTISFADTKSSTITAANVPKLLIANANHWRKFTPIECERLQTLPDGYTEGVSNAQRYKALGNGWTVAVIAHILKGLYLLS